CPTWIPSSGSPNSLDGVSTPTQRAAASLYACRSARFRSGWGRSISPRASRRWHCSTGCPNDLRARRATRRALARVAAAALDGGHRRRRQLAALAGVVAVDTGVAASGNHVAARRGVLRLAAGVSHRPVAAVARRLSRRAVPVSNLERRRSRQRAARRHDRTEGARVAEPARPARADHDLLLPDVRRPARRPRAVDG